VGSNSQLIFVVLSVFIYILPLFQTIFQHVFDRLNDRLNDRLIRKSMFYVVKNEVSCMYVKEV
jgi:hypothetical protein